jgi:hypothetical protein
MHNVKRIPVTKSACYIEDTFMALSLSSIKRAFTDRGGLLFSEIDPKFKPGERIASRPDRWVLEVKRYDGVIHAWVRAINETNAVCEKVWVLDWLVRRHQFKPNEAEFYYESNIPDRRELAPVVGQILHYGNIHGVGVRPPHEIKLAYIAADRIRTAITA